jgi:hypothetical protein
MSYELRNQSTTIFRKYSKQFWAKALELAQLYGWKPMGTHPPCPDVDWLGTYLTNEGQTVKTIDAFLLADALQKSLDYISDTAPNLDWNPKLWIEDDLPEWLSPEEKEMIEECLQDGLLDIIAINPLDYFAGNEKYDLTQFIRFCRLGSFVIS